MEVKAKLNRLRIAPRKVRLVLAIIRNLDVEQARHQLQFLHKRAAQPILKLLNSAIANAENNFKLEKSNLFIKNVFANEGPVLKRYKPRAFGRASEIRKRSSNIELILAEKKISKKKSKIKQEKKQTKEELKIVNVEEVQKDVLLDKKKWKEKNEIKPVIKLKEIKDKLIHRTGEK